MPGAETDPGSGPTRVPALPDAVSTSSGIGGSGLSAYANIARALGADVRGWDVRDTIFMANARRDRRRYRRRAVTARGLGGDRLHRARTPDPGCSAGGVSRRARLRAAGHRRGWRAREDDDGRDDRVRAAQGRARSLMDHRRRRSSARRQRRRGRRVARRGRRRVGSLDRCAATGDRGHHQRRARPSRDVRVGGRVAFVLRQLARRRAPCRPQLGTRSGRARARGARGAQPAERSSGSRRARARGRAPSPRRSRHCSSSGVWGAGSSSSANEAGSPSTTTTAITRPSSRSRCGWRGSAPAGVSSPSTSPMSTSARGICIVSSGKRSRSRTLRS